jgi:hypothetical protein
MSNTRVVTLSVAAAILAIAAASYVLLRPESPASGYRPPRELEPLPPPFKSDSVTEIRKALLAELKTVTLKNCTLKRYGGAADGGYLMCENLAGRARSAYSYGIDTEDNWGCDISRQFDLTIHQYDCFTDHRPTCNGGHFVFHDECVGPKRDTVDNQLFDTIASQIERNGDAGKRLLLKIDVEGAEWDSFAATSDAVFDLIDQIPMELHGTDEAKFVDVVRRMKRQFYLVNLHFNNHACDPSVAPFPSWAFQVLWVNRRLGEVDPAGPSPAPMSPLNKQDNEGGLDCQLPPPAP